MGVGSSADRRDRPRVYAAVMPSDTSNDAKPEDNRQRDRQTDKGIGMALVNGRLVQKCVRTLMLLWASDGFHLARQHEQEL